MLVDTHCHLDDPALRARLPQLLHDAAAAGIGASVVPGVHPAAWHGILSLSRENHPPLPRIFPAFGLHPMHADLLDQPLLRELERLAPCATAIGEIGLDYALPAPERTVQRRAFVAQLDVARRHDLPVLIHCRRAFGDLLEILRGEGGTVRGVMHAFSGSVESAETCVRLGLAISVCGTITYANAVKPLAVAAAIPLEHLLLETDAPDMPPEPHRGAVNLPEYLALTARKLAEVKGVTVDEVAAATTANATRLFNLPH